MQLPKILLPAAFAITLLIFLYWLFTVLMPITLVELGYQYRSVLRDVFNVTDIRGLIIPQFRFDLRGFTSKNTINGITIPTLFLDEPVVFNVDPNDERAYKKALQNGIAHASSTSFPGSGGLGYYFAHSSSPEFVRQYNAVFYLLGKLKEGDDIYIWHEGKRSNYKVMGKRITKTNDVSFLHDSYGQETIVLQTCWPPGTTKERLLVFAKFTD